MLQVKVDVSVREMGKIGVNMCRGGSRSARSGGVPDRRILENLEAGGVGLTEREGGSMFRYGLDKFWFRMGVMVKLKLMKGNGNG